MKEIRYIVYLKWLLKDLWEIEQVCLVFGQPCDLPVIWGIITSE